MSDKSQIDATGGRAPAVELSARERARYSLRRAVCVAAGLEDDRSFEREVSDEISRNLPSSYHRRGGIFVPTFLSRAGLDAHASGKGSELVFDEPGSFISALRRRALVLRLGARLVTGLRGDVGFPRQDTAGAAHWMSDNPGTPVPESNMTLSQVPLRPRILTSATSFTRQLLVQSAPAVDGIVADDMAQSSALALDLAAVHGSGEDNEPLGLYHLDEGIAEVDFSGAGPTLAKVVAMETAVAVEDGETDPESGAYLTTPEVRERAKLTEELTGSGVRLWREGRMNDHRAEATNQLAKDLGDEEDEHALVYGIWPELVVGEWGAVELLVDPFTGVGRGIIEVTSFYLADVAPRHPQSFCRGAGLVP